ncbi:hypothetical protein Hanom_Chr10g00961601 [Helianthus anomalus]
MYSLKFTIYIYVYCQILNYTHMYIITFKLYICVYYEKFKENVWSRMFLKFLIVNGICNVMVCYIRLWCFL